MHFSRRDPGRSGLVQRGPVFHERKEPSSPSAWYADQRKRPVFILHADENCSTVGGSHARPLCCTTHSCVGKRASSRMNGLCSPPFAAPRQGVQTRWQMAIMVTCASERSEFHQSKVGSANQHTLAFGETSVHLAPIWRMSCRRFSFPPSTIIIPPQREHILRGDG